MLVRYLCTYNKALSIVRLCISFVFLLSRSYATRMRRKKVFLGVARIGHGSLRSNRSEYRRLGRCERGTRILAIAANAARFEKSRVIRKSR
jgi:hypothetical protein